jgi:hypothetical protein
MSKKIISIALIAFFVAVGIFVATHYVGQRTEEDSSGSETIDITGTYVWDMDADFYIKLERNDRFSFRGTDKLYSGTWEIEDSDGIVLHFPPGSVYFTNQGDYDWVGTIIQGGEALGMEPSGGSILLGTSVGGIAYFEKR